MTRNSTSTSWSHSWDPSNRLLGVTSNDVAQGVYAYDGRGRRVESVEVSTVFYAFYGTETLSELVAGGATTDYVYAGGLRIARVSGTAINYYHTDGLGSTRLVTDSSRSIVFTDGYQPFGQDNGTPAGSETYRFTGKPVSTTTGLYYEYQRRYDPSTGRFISQDRFPGICRILGALTSI